MPVSGIPPVNPLQPSNQALTQGKSQVAASPNGPLAQTLSSPKGVGGHHHGGHHHGASSADSLSPATAATSSTSSSSTNAVDLTA